MDLTALYYEALYYLIRMNATQTLLYVLELATGERIDAILKEQVPAERVFLFEPQPLHIIG